MPTANNSLQVLSDGHTAGDLLQENNYIFRYSSQANSESFVSLTMPVRASSYEHSHIFPIFEMHLPEGYLLSIIKRQFTKLIGKTI